MQTSKINYVILRGKHDRQRNAISVPEFLTSRYFNYLEREYLGHYFFRVLPHVCHSYKILSIKMKPLSPSGFYIYYRSYYYRRLHAVNSKLSLIDLHTVAYSVLVKGLNYLVVVAKGEKIS